jgi:formylglycine-generating enzyme required for sulfatase activity
LPSSRAKVIDDEDGRPRESSLGEEPVRGFVRVVAGEFSAGEIGWADNPKRVTSLASPVYFGRTLVTVAQYHAFMAAGGYEDEALWVDAGRLWLQGKLPSPDRLQGSAGAALSGMLREPVDRRQPWRWAEQQANPGRPVQGVSWFEAAAYAAWLNRQLGGELRAAGLAEFQVRLPDEYEWERAARAASATRADQRHYPWGDDSEPDAAYANLQSAGLGQPSTVGLFPPNPLGLYDLAGNVWEWTASVHVEPGVTDHGPPVAATPMSVRGGSFRDVTRQARCAARASQPVVWSALNVGLRVVIGRPLARDSS